MKITDEMIKHLLKLSKLELDDEQKNSVKNDLEEILNYVDILNTLDTDSVEPLSHTFPITNVMRDDEVENSSDRDLLLSNAPDKSDGCFKVHKTVE